MYELLDRYITNSWDKCPSILYAVCSGFSTFFDRAFVAKVIQSLRRVMYDKTIIMPSFSFDFCDRGIFSVKYSKTYCGIVCEAFRKMSDVQRTKYSPIHSVSILGKLASYFKNRRYTSSFGEDSFFNDLRSYDSGVLLIDCSFDDGVPFVHCLEEKFKASYRKYKEYHGVVYDGKNSYELTFLRNVRIRDCKLSTLHISDGFYSSSKVNRIKYEHSYITFFWLNDFYKYFTPIFNLNPDIMDVTYANCI